MRLYLLTRYLTKGKHMMKFTAVFNKGTMTGVSTGKQTFEFEAKTLRGAKMKASNLAGYVSVSDSLRLFDEHGTQIDVKTHEEWLYGTTDMPAAPVADEVEVEEPADDDGETLMTYSYFHATGAKVNKFDVYVSDMIMIKRDDQKSPKGYVFYKWVDIANSIALYVKPSERLLERIKQVMGYSITAMVPRLLQDGSVRLVGTFQTDLPGFTHSAVLGDIAPSCADKIDDYYAEGLIRDRA